MFLAIYPSGYRYLFLGAIKFPEDNITGSMTNGEVVMIGFILLLWLYVIRIFLQKWGEEHNG